MQFECLRSLAYFYCHEAKLAKETYSSCWDLLLIFASSLMLLFFWIGFQTLSLDAGKLVWWNAYIYKGGLYINAFSISVCSRDPGWYKCQKKRILGDEKLCTSCLSIVLLPRNKHCWKGVLPEAMVAVWCDVPCSGRLQGRWCCADKLRRWSAPNQQLDTQLGHKIQTHSCVFRFGAVFQQSAWMVCCCWTKCMFELRRNRTNTQQSRMAL